MPAVNPDILVWARDTAGLSLEEAVPKLGLKDARGVPAADRLRAIEGGQVAPDRALLLKMAKVYRRPLLTFYLSVQPRKGDRGHDFRSLPQRHTNSEPLVDALVRDVRARQSMVRAILEDEEDAEPLKFIGSMNIEDGVGTVLAAIRQCLQIDLAEFRAQGTPEGGFALLRMKVEAAGVFVLLIGDLGSRHTSIDVSAFRGFALADFAAPFIVINDQDSRSAWSFTLMHELTHLWLGITGVSGGNLEGRIEQFCNDVASNFLLPGSDVDLIGIDGLADHHSAARLITEFAGDRLVSRSMVAYRLFQAGSISRTTWIALNGQFEEEWRQSRAARRKRDVNKKGGPSYYVVRRHRLGSALLGFVRRNLSAGNLTHTRAGKVLGVKPRNVAPLLGGSLLSAGSV